MGRDGKVVVELEGPQRLSPNNLAAAFAKLMGHPVRAEAVARESWDALFRAQGAQNPIPRIRMLDGFNEGWIDFPDGCARAIKGTTDAEAVIARLVQRAGTAIG